MWIDPSMRSAVGAAAAAVVQVDAAVVAAAVVIAWVYCAAGAVVVVVVSALRDIAAAFAVGSAADRIEGYVGGAFDVVVVAESEVAAVMFGRQQGVEY